MPSKLTLIFLRSAQKYALDLQNKDWIFDARIIKLTKKEIINYFLSRQAFAIDKYLMQLKGEYRIDYKINTSKAVITKLNSIDIRYEALPDKYKFGLIYSPKEEVKPFEFDADKNRLKTLCFSR